MFALSEKTRSYIFALLLSFAVLAMSATNALAVQGYGYKNSCYVDTATAITAVLVDSPFVSQGKTYTLFTGTLDANPYIYHARYRVVDLATAVESFSDVNVYFRQCTLHTNPAQTTLGSLSSTCVNESACTNSDVVQTNLITQDTIIYSIAAFLFFFGFFVGLQIMLGSLNHGGYRE